jgi:carboxylesterase type B
MFLSSLLFSAGLLFSRGQSLPIDGTPTVSTTSGTLQGLSSNNVNIFLGVPYAQPPIGDLRWKPAVPVNDSTIPVNATQFGPGCGQLQVPGYGSVYADVGIIPPPKIQSEDCLSLNVWTPRNAEKLPVLIFIHGGAYQTGSSDNVAYGGDHLASTGRAIVVSIQYRLNIWGYPSTTAVDGLTQNVGTTDARLALEWVSDNIASFGGDPERIVVSGHSAGASLTDSLLYAYKENPIAAGVIIASAAVGTIAAAPTDGELWNLVSDSLGCGNTTNTDQVFHNHSGSTSVLIFFRSLVCAKCHSRASTMPHFS